jgi:hypothetical protein
MALANVAARKRAFSTRWGSSPLVGDIGSGTGAVVSRTPLGCVRRFRLVPLGDGAEARRLTSDCEKADK